MGIRTARAAGWAADFHQPWQDSIFKITYEGLYILSSRQGEKSRKYMGLLEKKIEFLVAGLLYLKIIPQALLCWL